MSLSHRELRELNERIEALLGAFDAPADARLRQTARTLTAEVMQLYGVALARIVALIKEDDQDTARRVLDRLADDDHVSSLLVLHDVHPHDAARRITRVLSRVTALCGAPVVLVETGSTVRVRFEGPLNAWSTPGDVRALVGELVRVAAPDTMDVVVEGLPEAPPPELVTLRRSSTPTPVADSLRAQ